MKVRTEAKREAILGVASQVFMEFGFERASMAEIAARVGGSKATLYGYFPSKEALFIEVTTCMGEAHMEKSVAGLAACGPDNPRPALQAFGEDLLAFIASPDKLAVHRMVMSEAGSDAARLFYETGPKKGLHIMSGYLAAAMEKGQFRKLDPWVAAHHLMALLMAERQYDSFLLDGPPLTRTQVKRCVERALDVFFGGYQPVRG